MELGYKNSKVVYFFLSGFSFAGSYDSQNSKNRDVTIFIPLYHFRLVTKIQTFICIWLDYFLFLIVGDVITTPLFDKVIPPPDFMSDFNTAFCHRQAMDLISHRLSPYYYKGSDWLVELAIHVLPMFVSRNTRKI